MLLLLYIAPPSTAWLPLKVDIVVFSPSVRESIERYPILYPTEYLEKDKADKMIDIILQGFDKWNTDLDSYINWLNDGYTSDALSYGLEGEERNMKTYKDAMEALTENKTIKKLYFDNILVRDNWAAIHYRYRIEYKETNQKEVGDRMQFLKIVLTLIIVE